MSFKLMFFLSVLAFSSVALADTEQRSTQEPAPTAVLQVQTSDEAQKQKEEELDAARARRMEQMMNRGGR